MPTKSVQTMLEDIRLVSVDRYAVVEAVRALVKKSFKPFAEEARHDLLHFIEQDLLARAPAAAIKAKVFLFHAVFDRNLHASVTPIGAEF